MVAQYIATRPILDLYERTTQKAGMRVSWRWWQQKSIDLKAAKELAADTLLTDSDSESESEAEVEVQAEPKVGGEERSTSSGVSGSSAAEWIRT